MKIHAKTTLVSIPVLLSLATTTYAGTCTGPCNVDDTTDPEIHLRDTSNFGQDWEIQNIQLGNQDSRLEFGVNGISNSFIIENAAGNNTLVIDDNNFVGIGTATPGETLEVNSAQPAIRLNDNNAGRVDMEMSGNLFEIQGNNNTPPRFLMETNGGVANQLYLDSGGNVGIQVANPADDLHVGGTNGSIRQDNISGQYYRHYTQDDYTLQFNNGTITTNVLTIENDDSVCYGAGGAEIAPCVGFFEAVNPDASVHIKKSDGHTQLLIEETSGTTAIRQLMYMKNNGGVGFGMEDTSNSVVWDFRTNNAGTFIINDIGDSTELSLTQSGNMVVKGNIVANGIFLTSSRAAKADILPVSTSDVMTKLRKISVEEWRYKEADKNDRHISPMAEDFHSLFKFGSSNKHINPNDLASVAIIAAKELQKQSDLVKAENTTLRTELEEQTASLRTELEEQTATLKAENSRLQKRLATLENIMSKFVSTNTNLDLKNKIVAIK